MQSNWHSHTLLMGMQNGIVTLGNSLAPPYEIQHNLPNEPAISLLSVYPGEMKTYVHTKTCMQMFVLALFVIVKKWQSSRCPSVSVNG